MTQIAFRIQEVVLGWQILEVTDSAFWVGVVGFAYGIPLLILSPFTGFLADRVKRQWLVTIALFLAAIASVGLALLTAHELVGPIHILTTSFILGSCFTLYAPARLALLPNLVPKDQILNASTFEYSTTRLMGFIGPIIAGFLLNGSGTAPTLLVQMVVFGLAGLVYIRTGLNVDQPAGAPENGSILHGLRDSVAYLRRDPPLLALILLGLVIVPMGMTYTKIMPVFVREALDAGPSILGLMLGMARFGSAISGFTIAAIGDVFRKGYAVLLSSVGFGAGLILFAFSDRPPAALALLFGVGVVSGVFLTLSQVLLQSESPDAVRGRVVSLWGMVWGLIPFTSLAAGAAAERWDVAIVVATTGVVCVLYCVAIMVIRAELLEL